MFFSSLIFAILDCEIVFYHCYMSCRDDERLFQKVRRNKKKILLGLKKYFEILMRFKNRCWCGDDDADDDDVNSE
jgi:hypothetical protein